MYHLIVMSPNIHYMEVVFPKLSTNRYLIILLNSQLTKMKVVRENFGSKMSPVHFSNQNGWTWNNLIYLAWKKCDYYAQFYHSNFKNN